MSVFFTHTNIALDTHQILLVSVLRAFERFAQSVDRAALPMDR